MARRLLIIQPSHYRSKADRRVSKTRRRPVVPLTLPYLAALTPRDWEVDLVDEQLQDLDFDAPVDVVAISTWTLMSLRAYDIADAFRRRGVPVILGGPHMYFHAEEALGHCNAVGIGEGETIWSRMLEDASAGRLLPIYRGEVLDDLAGLPVPRYELLDMRRYGPFRTFTVQSSRGCPFHCEFCSERFYLGEAYRLRPVDEVVDEIKRCRTKSIFFADSNFGGKRARAMELMEALVPLKLRWSALWSSYLCNDDEFMDLAQRSGLLHLNVGIESIDPDTLETMKKRFNKVSKYAEMVAGLRRRGISFSLNFIFGWDGESPDAFAATLAFLQEHKVPVAYFNILKPEKGTPLFDRMLSEGRILDAEEIGRWPGQVCAIKPTSCTPTALERRVTEMYGRFYSLRSIVTRLPVPWTKANIASWVVNFSQRRMARPRAGGGNFEGF
jgi:radical SAM superfamily enzyme YgiQ (UPF0313 family)